MSRGLFVYLIFDLVFTGVVRLVVNVPFRHLLQMFVMVFACGVVAAVLTYWSNRAYRRPALRVFRLTVTAFVYAAMFMFVLLLTAANVGLVAKTSVLTYLLSTILPGSILAAISVYVSGRIKLKHLYPGGFQ